MTLFLLTDHFVGEEIENVCFIYIYMYVDLVSYIKPEF